MGGEITSYRLLRGVSALVGLGEGQREPYSLQIDEVVGVDFEPPHGDEGSPKNYFLELVNLPVKCSCFELFRVVTALVSRCGDEWSCTCFQNEQSPRSLLVISKSPRFLAWLIDAVTGSLYVEFSWFLFTIFVVLCSLLNFPDLFLKLTLTGHEQNALQV